VRSWVDTREREEVEEILEGAGAPKAVEAWQAVWSARDDRQRESVYATAEQALDVFADDAVEAACARSEITPDALLDGGQHTLYLVAPPAQMERLAPLFVALIEEIADAVAARHTATGRPLSAPLLLALDELANAAPLPKLARYAAMGAGAGMRLVSVVQDLSQLAGLYGEGAETIASNHRALLVLPGLRDQRTLTYLRTVLGDEEIEQVSVTAGHRGGVRSRQRSTHRVGLGRAEVIRQLAPGTAVLVYGALAPARLRLRFWFREPALRRLAAGRPAMAPARQLPARAGEAVSGLGADVAAAVRPGPAAVVDRATGEVLGEPAGAEVIDLEARRRAAAIDRLEDELGGGEGGEEGTR
jgi:type IV secretion system protein VirD4